MNDEQKDIQLAKAEMVLGYLDKLFAERLDYLHANIAEFDQACDLYAKGVILKARLASRGETQ